RRRNTPQIQNTPKYPVGFAPSIGSIQHDSCEEYLDSLHRCFLNIEAPSPDNYLRG
ncbi:unnamed protein product, partial [Allacma fusca]